MLIFRIKIALYGYLRGCQYRDTGSPVSTVHLFSGEYTTERERKSGQHSGHHSAIYGLYSEEQPNRTMSLMVSWRDGASVTGWVGK